MSVKQQPALRQQRRRRALTVGLLASALFLAGCAVSKPSARPVSQSASAPDSSLLPPTTKKTPTTTQPLTMTPPPTPPTSANPTPPSRTARSVVGTRADVPWGEIGSGWFLVVDDATPAALDAKLATQTLWLVAPTGDRYSLLSWPAGGSSPMVGAQLVDWSFDGKRALAVGYASGSGAVIEIDLTTGSLRRARVPNITDASYTRPAGANIVIRTDLEATNGAVVGSTIRRGVLAGDGKPFDVKATLFEGGASVSGLVYSPDGARLYTGDRDSVLVISNAGGKLLATRPVQPGAESCTPLSWWSAGTLLVTCSAAQGFRLWTVPVDGGTPTAMTARPGSEGVGLGYDNAVRAGGMTLLQHPLACGVEDIHRLGAGGIGTKLDVEGSLGNDHIVGTAGARIAVRSSTECGMPSWFGFVDPATGATSIVLPGSTQHRGPGMALAFDR